MLRRRPTKLAMTTGLAIALGGLAWLAFLVGGVRVSADEGSEATETDDANTEQRGEPADVTDEQPEKPYRELTPDEERVIVHKGTEPPFSGEYDDHFSSGIYGCRRCGAMLYRSEDKFRSGCGWPAFDDELPGAVERLPDADGIRTEIICANCGGHLGHVFAGEGLTPKNTRHCANSISLVFTPAEEVQYGRAIFAGGCFWGVEYWLQRQPGVIETTVGYTGGTTENPTYEDLHTSDTGHAEAVETLYDPVRISFEELARLFFETHDSTQLNRQGPDIGAEYRSAIFYLDEEQQQVAETLMADLRARGLNVVTQLVPAARFWPAEDYHQDYLLTRGATPTCHFHKPLW